MFRLRYDTPPAWQDAVRSDLVAFMQDHAHNERKAASSALVLANRYFRRTELVAAMIELAAEELDHFRRVHDVLAARGETIGQDRPDPYTGPLYKLIRKRDHNEGLLDRLLISSLVEARGCERFRLASEVMPDPELKAFYVELFECEARHHGLFLELARTYFGRDLTDARMDELLDAEAAIVAGLEHRPALH